MLSGGGEGGTQWAEFKQVLLWVTMATQSGRGGGVVTLRGSKEGLLLFILKCTYIKYLPLGSPPPDLPLNTAK